MKGRKLKVGQHVLILRARKKAGISVTVLTVVAIEYPFVVFSYKCPNQAALIMGPNGPQMEAATGNHIEHFTMDVRKCRFKEVSKNFTAASEEREESLPSWMTND